MPARELRGTLGRNQKREPGSNQFKGSCLIGGTEFWISGWVNENESGKFFSLAFQEKQPPKTETRPQASPELRAKYTTNGNARQDDRRPYRELPRRP